MEMNAKNFQHIFAKKRCQTTDIELQIVHNAWLKYHLEYSRWQCLTILFISFV